MSPLHVVVAGHGMVGDRFAAEVRRHDPAGRRVRLTILAAESRPAYNRVLLPNLLSGVMLEEDLMRNGRWRLPGPNTDLRTGVAATRLDLAAQTVSTDGAEHIRYDALVLATGARAWVPPIPGTVATARSDKNLASDVSVLRSVADASRIRALAQAARRKGGRIAVLGGGVLGIEAARALAARGTAVTVVHRGPRLMERQLDAPAARVLATAVRRTGVAVELGTGAAGWEPGRGLRLTDGRLVPAAGLLLCTGTEPDTALARDCGLKLTESGAIAVDDALATSDPAVYAIGDCAGHPGAAGGLVQPGWEQAAVLAARLTGASPAARYLGSGTVTRLKAAGIELTCVGEPLTEEGEVLRFEDPIRERYAKLVLAGDRVAGAIMIGLPDAAAGIIQLYDRGAPAPADRLALLLGRALPPEGHSGPGGLPDHAIVCRCNMVTKGQLRSAWYGGASNRAALSAATRAATGCGTCGDDLDAVTAWLTLCDPNQADPNQKERALL
jgi:assimilatory nitrate reductase electron transfer subunit